MAAYNASEWSDLFIATAGASAALAGLVFVAVSINVERILKFEELPARAQMTVLLLLSVLIVSIIGLIPGQSRTALGVELLGEGLLFGAAIAVLAKRSLSKQRVVPGSVLINSPTPDRGREPCHLSSAERASSPRLVAGSIGR